MKRESTPSFLTNCTHNFGAPVIFNQFSCLLYRHLHQTGTFHKDHLNARQTVSSIPPPPNNEKAIPRHGNPYQLPEGSTMNDPYPGKMPHNAAYAVDMRPQATDGYTDVALTQPVEDDDTPGYTTINKPSRSPPAQPAPPPAYEPPTDAQSPEGEHLPTFTARHGDHILTIM